MFQHSKCLSLQGKRRFKFWHFDKYYKGAKEENVYWEWNGTNELKSTFIFAVSCFLPGKSKTAITTRLAMSGLNHFRWGQYQASYNSAWVGIITLLVTVQNKVNSILFCVIWDVSSPVFFFCSSKCRLNYHFLQFQTAEKRNKQ